jgi:ATP-dependent Lon protease
MDDTAQVQGIDNIVTDFKDDLVLLQKKLGQSHIPEGLREETSRVITRLARIARYGNYSTEFERVDRYIDWITRIPWASMTKDNYDLQNAKQIMDSTHYGMETIKNLILDYLAVMQLQNQGFNNISREPTNLGQNQFSNPYNVPAVADNRDMASSKSPVLLFVGLQGVGKTTIAKSIAKSMGRKFSRVSLGAIGDVRTIRGVPRYVDGAEPGQIIKSLIRTQSMNPVILLDEIEKSSRQSGLLHDVIAALLEILDPEQNKTFVDHYVDYPVDLSNVFFICTANNLGGLSAAILDRVEVIRFVSYSDEDKEVIGKQYVLPRVLKETGLTEQHLKIEEEVWPLLIRPVGFDAGVRQLERNIYTLVRSVARKLVTGTPPPIVINAENLRNFVLPDQGTLS